MQTAYASAMLQGLSSLAGDAKSWPFEQARALLSRVLKLRLAHADAEAAAVLIHRGDVALAAQRHPELAARPVLFETGYGPSGLPHIGTFNEVARTSMVRTAFRALTEDAIATKLV